MAKLFSDDSGRQWTADLGALTGGGAATPGTDLSHLYNRAILIFRSVDRKDEIPFSDEEIPLDWQTASDSDFRRWLAAARQRSRG